jgi:hypothetical protein
VAQGADAVRYIPAGQIDAGNVHRPVDDHHGLPKKRRTARVLGVHQSPTVIAAAKRDLFLALQSIRNNSEKKLEKPPGSNVTTESNFE